MKAIATSSFHGKSVAHTFIGLTPGKNIRRLPSNHCQGDGYARCGCGYPIIRTSWKLLSDEYVIGYVGSRTTGGSGYMIINIVSVQ